MTTNALYVVKENGEVSYFYTEYLGGYSYPFKTAEAIRTVQESEERPRTAAEILPSLEWTGDPNLKIPMGQTFQQLSEDEYVGKLESTTNSGEIPFTIGLDLDASEVAITFNHNCPEFHHLPSVTIPLYGSPYEVCGDSLNEIADAQWQDQESGEARALGIERIYANLISDHARSPRQAQHQGPAMSL